MTTFVLRRLLQTLPMLLGVAAVTFLLLHLAPGDYLGELAMNPAVSPETLAGLRHRFGLDQPWYVQFGLYLRNMFLRFDLGMSFSRNQPVTAVLGEGMVNTLLLAGSAALITWGLAIPLGVLAAVRQHRFVDRALSVLAFAWLSVPEVLSALLLLALAARTGWFPIGGMHGIDSDTMGPLARAGDLLRHLALPALVTGLVPLAARMRQMRGAMLDVMRLEFVTTARAKGLGEGAVVYRHALRNALNPLITLFGYTLGALLSGSLVAEIVFGWPGLGRITYEAVTARDLYLVVGSVLMAAVMLVLGNLVADLLLALADPRIVHD